MDTKYIDELILHEYGKNNIDKYKKWSSDWYEWLKKEKN